MSGLFFHAAKQILDEFRPRFIEEMEAKDVAHELCFKGIIADSHRDQIVKEDGQRMRNEILHKCLKKTSTAVALRTFCDVAIQVGEKGNPAMEKLGQDIKIRLETCKCMMHVCVYVHTWCVCCYCML